MDQVRKILTWLKQQHFWVLCVLVSLIGLYCWWSGAGTLSKAFQANQAQIKQGFDNLTGVQNETFHANANIQKEQTRQTEEQAKYVAEIWQRLYDRQREGVLQWPDELGAAFIKYIDQREFGSDIERKYRAVYQNYIQNYFRHLPESIDAKPIPEGDVGLAGAGYSRGEMGPEATMMSPTGDPLLEEDNSICEWDPADQAILRQQLEFQEQPSPLRIWVTQEDLWVYQAMLNVIKNTNLAAKATRKSNAAVRIVHSLEAGQRAAPYSRTPNRIFRVPAAAAAAGGDPMAGGEFPSEIPAEQGAAPVGPPLFSAQPSPGSPGEQLSPEEELAALLNWRYLDPEGKPMGGGGGDPNNPEAAAMGAPPTIEELKSKEYKRLPVRMVMRMDLRYLPKLIAECADQPLQIEVQEVRILPADPTASSATRGMGGGELTGTFGAQGTQNMFSTAGGTQMFDPQPHIATVAVQGVIYIFNPPNMDLLKAEVGDQVAVTP